MGLCLDKLARWTIFSDITTCEKVSIFQNNYDGPDSESGPNYWSGICITLLKV